MFRDKGRRTRDEGARELTGTKDQGRRTFGGRKVSCAELGFCSAAIVCVFLMAGAVSALQPSSSTPHIVFVTGDDEYRSEITMPMIAAIL